MQLDAHQHFWRLSRGDYGWLTPDLAPLYRDFEPADLAPLHRDAGIEASIAVQAAPTLAETRHLLALADATPWIRGVVGWVDLLDLDVGATLAELQQDRAFRGVRPMLQDLPDPDWVLQPALAPGLRELEARGLCFDALVHPVHLPRLGTLLRRHPRLRLVIDHAAKPDIAGRVREPWARDLARLAAETGAHCKLSGLVTEAGASGARPNWQVDDLRFYADHILEHFGPERVMWGSDWPVVELAGGWSAWRDATETLLSGLSAEARAAVLGGSAAAFYGVREETSA